MNENQEQVNNTQTSLNGENISINNTNSMASSGIPSVPPIAEVKVEANNTVITDDNLSQNNTTSLENNSKNSSEPPKNNKVSTILLILLFIFLFGFVMGMPYIREYVQNIKSDTGLSEIEKDAKKEEEKQQQQQQSQKPTPTPEDEKTKELVCTSNSNSFENYTLVEIQKFYYNSKNQILNSKKISQYNFTTIDEAYTSLKKQCDEDSLKYLTHKGYTMACSYGETNIEISHEFDLETFTPIVDGATNIQANATYQQSLDTIKDNLISQGYTCK